MSLSHYSSQCAPSLQGRLPPDRRLVIIDTASRIATRVLERQRVAQMLVTDDTGAEQIEDFRVDCGGRVFSELAKHVAKDNN